MSKRKRFSETAWASALVLDDVRVPLCVLDLRHFLENDISDVLVLSQHSAGLKAEYVSRL